MLVRMMFVSLLLALVGVSGIASAEESDDAAKAAKEILAALGKQQYELIYDSKASKLFKEKMSKDDFLANMHIGRAALGKSGESKLLDTKLYESDPVSGYKGKIYTFNFLNSYANGQYYEAIVVVQDSDGQFRLSGLRGKPVEKEQTPQ